MAIQTQLRRGTDTENDAFTGAVGEVTVDTTLDELRVHDGSRAGGFNVPNFSSIQKQTYSYGTAGGTADALTLSTLENPPALVAGLTCSVKAASDNTGAATLAWGSLTATAIKKWSSGTKVDLAADDLLTGVIYTFIYDGTHFILMGGNSTLPINTVTQQVFTSSGTYTPSAGMVYCIIEMVGGGGGGGGNNSSDGSGGGGGGGEYSESVKTATDIGASKTVTIGAAGSAGTGSGNGGTGGTTSVGSLVTAVGGTAGRGSASTPNTTVAGGTGGTGDHRIPGGFGRGAMWDDTGAGTITYKAGDGGDSQWGNGSIGAGNLDDGGRAHETARAAATGYGAGGSGGGPGSDNGSAGTAGKVVITEFRNV